MRMRIDDVARRWLSDMSANVGVARDNIVIRKWAARGVRVLAAGRGVT